MSKKYQIRVSLYKSANKKDAIEVAQDILDNVSSSYIRSVRVYKWVPDKKSATTEPKLQPEQPNLSKFRNYLEAKLNASSVDDVATVMECFDVISLKLGKL